MKEATCTPLVLNRKHVPVVVSVEGKIHSTGPLQLDGLQHVHMDLLPERILRVNKE